ncbi:MAG: hypothetical protein KC994_11555 [Candidatus Omnitrophica bacterium]|nr:hypothetical protein [Candidatus Omnitrophota bacterium]
MHHQPSFGTSLKLNPTKPSKVAVIQAVKKISREASSYLLLIALGLFFEIPAQAQIPTDTCMTATIIQPASLPYYSERFDTRMNTDTIRISAGADAAINDIYWQFTPEVSGPYMIASKGYDNVIGVFTGDCGSLVEIAAQDNDSFEADFGERLVIDLTAGTTYTIVVEGRFEGYVGFLHLTLNHLDFPINDDCEEAPEILPSKLPYRSYANTLFHADTFDIDENEESAPDAFWRFTPEQSGRYRVTAGDFATEVIVLTGSCGSLVEASRIDEDNYGDEGESFTIELEGGTAYTFLVTGEDADNFGPVDFELDRITVAANDTCEQAVTIPPTSLPYSDTADLWNYTSTIDLSMVSINASEGFWKFTPEVTGVYRISAEGERYHPRLGILTGDCGSLTEVYTGRKENLWEYGESIGMVLDAGTTYTLVVQSDNADTSGPVELTVEKVEAVVENDLCANATVIAPEDFPFDDRVDSAILTNDFDTDVDGGNVPEAFWRFTPDKNGPRRVSVGGGPDTILAVYSGECGDLTEVYVQDDNNFEGQGETKRLSLNAGVTYTIIGGPSNSDDEGVVTFHIADLTSPETGDTCAGPRVISPTAVPFFDSVDTGSLKSTRSFRVGGGQPDMWWKFTPERTGFYGLEVDSSYDAILVVTTDNDCGPTIDILSQDLTTKDPERAIVELKGGETYKFISELYTDFITGFLSLSLEEVDAPANASCDIAEVITPTSLPYSKTVNTYASSDTVDLTSGLGDSADALWRFTPGQTGSYRVSFSGFDTVLGVFSGDCGSLVPILDQDSDNLEGHGETAVVSLDSGVTYTFVGEGYSPFQRGSLTFEIEAAADSPTCPVPPFCVSNDWFETGEGLSGDLNSDGKVDGEDAILLKQD